MAYGLPCDERNGLSEDINNSATNTDTVTLAADLM